jgi:transcription elongation factor Elf1
VAQEIFVLINTFSQRPLMKRKGCPLQAKFNCLFCEGDLNLVSQDVKVAKKYDYKETTHYYYYKCVDCDKMFDEMIKSTGLRNLSLANREKAEKLALQPHN